MQLRHNSPNQGLSPFRLNKSHNFLLTIDHVQPRHGATGAVRLPQGNDARRTQLPRRHPEQRARQGIARTGAAFAGKLFLQYQHYYFKVSNITCSRILMCLLAPGLLLQITIC